MAQQASGWGARIPPRLSPYIWAVGLGAVALVFEMLQRDVVQADAMRRVLYAAAATLLWHDLIVVAQARPGARSLREPRRWYLAYTVGGFWGTFMLIVAWAPDVPVWSQALLWATAGAFFGGVMALQTADSGWEDEAAPYDFAALDRSSNWTRRFMVGWPLVALALLAGLAAFPPEGGWGEGYFLFQVIFLMTLAGPLPKGGVTLANAFWPRLWGTVLLVVGLLAL